MNEKQFIKVDPHGSIYAGDHLLIELTGAQRLTDAAYIQKVIETCAKEAKATVLHSYYHPFLNQGVSGVTIIAESHISIHTWPEYCFASIDCYMCGCCDPNTILPVIEEKFRPAQMNTQMIRRGLNFMKRFLNG